MDYNNQNLFDELIEIKEEVLIKSEDEDPLNTEVLEGSIVPSCDLTHSESDSGIFHKNVPTYQWPGAPSPCTNTDQGTCHTTTPIAAVGGNYKVVLAKNALNQNMLLTVPESYECELCHMKFINSVLLNNHRVICNSQKLNEPLECEFCHVKFINPALLNKHRLICNSQKVKECPFCNKKYKLLLFYNEHMKTHIQETQSNYQEFTQCKPVLFKSIRSLNSNNMLQAPTAAICPQQVVSKLGSKAI